MTRRYRWNYADAATSRVGLMICTACRKPIGTGLFRYRETDDAYLPQHQACCEADPKWAAIDAASEAKQKHTPAPSALELAENVAAKAIGFIQAVCNDEPDWDQSARDLNDEIYAFRGAVIAETRERQP